MRVGCSTFSSGLRWRPGSVPAACPRCGEPDGMDHTRDMRCKDVSSARGRMRERIVAERAAEAQRRVDLDEQHGRPTRSYKIRNSIDHAILSSHPDAVLEFIRSVPSWLDVFADPGVGPPDDVKGLVKRTTGHSEKIKDTT